MLLTTGLFLLVLLTLFLGRLSPGVLLLLFLLALSRLLFLFGRLGCWLLFRFGLMLVLFGFCFLILLSVGGSSGSEKKDHSSDADKPDWFHTSFLHCQDFRDH